MPRYQCHWYQWEQYTFFDISIRPVLITGKIRYLFLSSFRRFHKYKLKTDLITNAITKSVIKIFPVISNWNFELWLPNGNQLKQQLYQLLHIIFQSYIRFRAIYEHIELITYLSHTRNRWKKLNRINRICYFFFYLNENDKKISKIQHLVQKDQISFWNKRIQSKLELRASKNLFTIKNLTLKLHWSDENQIGSFFK